MWRRLRASQFLEKRRTREAECGWVPARAVGSVTDELQWSLRPRPHRKLFPEMVMDEDHFLICSKTRLGGEGSCWPTCLSFLHNNESLVGLGEGVTGMEESHFQASLLLGLDMCVWSSIQSEKLSQFLPYPQNNAHVFHNLPFLVLNSNPQMKITPCDRGRLKCGFLSDHMELGTLPSTLSRSCSF